MALNKGLNTQCEKSIIKLKAGGWTSVGGLGHIVYLKRNDVARQARRLKEGDSYQPFWRKISLSISQKAACCRDQEEGLIKEEQMCFRVNDKLEISDWGLLVIGRSWKSLRHQEAETGVKTRCLLILLFIYVPCNCWTKGVFRNPVKSVHIFISPHTYL